jgi:hypothetical protein
MVLPNGQKLYVLDIEILDSELLKLSGLLKMNDDEVGIDSQIIIHVSQINIIFERF